MAKNTYYVEVPVVGTRIFQIEADDEADLFEILAEEDLDDHTLWDDYMDYDPVDAQIIGGTTPDGKEI